MIYKEIYSRKLLVAIAVLFCSIPVFAVTLPPLTDYPNHLVRFWLLGDGQTEPHVSVFYKADWNNALTNVCVDYIAAVAGSIIPVEVVAKCFLIISAVAAPLGAALLSQKLFGRIGYWQVLIFVLAWTSPLLSGLISFELGIGIALIFAWLDLVLLHSDSRVGFFRRAFQGLVTILIHPFGFAYYAVLTAGLAAGGKSECHRDSSEFWTASKRIAIAWLPLAASVVLLTLKALDLPYESLAPGAGQHELIWQHFDAKDYALRLIEPLRSYDIWIDIAFIIAFAAPVIWALWRRSLEIHPGLIAIAGMLAILGYTFPESIDTTNMVNVRLLTMAIFTLAAGVYPEVGATSKTRQTLACLALLAVGSRCVWIEEVWRARQADVVSLYAVLDGIPEGSKILPVDAAEDVVSEEPIGRRTTSMPTYRHFAAMAVMRRHSFTPNIFAEKGKQPLTVLRPYDRISGFDPISIKVLKLMNPSDSALLNWKNDFDYVLLFNADIENSKYRAADVGLVPVSGNGFVALYRVARQ